MSEIPRAKRAPYDPARSGGRKMSLAEQASLLAPWVVRQCLAGRYFGAGDARTGISEFTVYASAKGIGDVLGHGHRSDKHPDGHPDTLGLHRGHGRKFKPCRENAQIGWHRCTARQQAELLTNLGITEEELAEKIAALPPA